MKTKYIIVYTVILSLFSLFIFSSCSEKPEDVLSKYELNFNSHNTTELMKLFDDGAEIELGITKIKGRANIQSYVEYDSVLNAKIKISDVTGSEGNAFFVMKQTNDLYKTVGIDTAKFSMIFEIKNGKIKHITGSTTPETDVKISNFRKPFMLWAAKEKLDLLNEMMPGANFNYSAENGIKYLSLVMQWKMNGGTSLVPVPKKEPVPHNF